MTAFKNIAFLVAIFSFQPKSWAKKLIDYKEYSHEVSLTQFRAGNHDQEGINEYFFKLKLTGYLKTKEEMRLEESKKKHITLDGGEHWSLTLPSLSIWKPDEKERSEKVINIEGDRIRKLVSSMMHKFKAKELEVAVKVTLTLFERGKKYYMFDDHKVITEKNYFIIPLTPTKKRKSFKISFHDEYGTFVSVTIDYSKKDQLETASN